MAERPGKLTGTTHVEHLKRATRHHASIRQTAGEKAAAAYARNHPKPEAPKSGN